MFKGRWTQTKPKYHWARLNTQKSISVLLKGQIAQLLEETRQVTKKIQHRHYSKTHAGTPWKKLHINQGARVIVRSVLAPAPPRLPVAPLAVTVKFP